MKTIARRAPIEDFEDKLLGYLEDLLDSFPAATLDNLNNGQLDGLSRTETADLLQRARYYEGA
jgi:hypothetical protein